MHVTTEELNKATEHWGKEIQSALDGRFGKEKVGYMLVLATTNKGGKMTFKTSLVLSGCVAFLRELADKVSRVITIH